MQQFSTCRICGAAMRGVVAVDPADGVERARLECEGPVPHTVPFMADLADVMAFRTRVFNMREGRA